MPARAPKHRPRSVPSREHMPAEAMRLSTTDRGYGTRWQKARLTFLKREPLCVECKRRGSITLARIVDHVIAHRGDQDLFWDTSNWQALCKRCHDTKTATEDGGFGNRSRPPSRT